jgi:hypothetical protein
MPFKDPQRRREFDRNRKRRRYRTAKDHPPKDPDDVVQAAHAGAVSIVSLADLRHPRFTIVHQGKFTKERL